MRSEPMAALVPRSPPFDPGTVTSEETLSTSPPTLPRLAMLLPFPFQPVLLLPPAFVADSATPSPWLLDEVDARDASSSSLSCEDGPAGLRQCKGTPRTIRFALPLASDPMVTWSNITAASPSHGFSSTTTPVDPTPRLWCSLGVWSFGGGGSSDATQQRPPSRKQRSTATVPPATPPQPEDPKRDSAAVARATQLP